MALGTVKWFNESKGFGFIHSEGKDYFLHYNELQGSGFKTVKEGQKVSFQAEPGNKGPVAKRVVVED